MSAATDPRFAEVQLGIEAEAFVHSKLGRYLIGRAEDERQRALEALATADPEDAKTIRQLQNQQWRANTVLGWLAEAIETGAHLEAELTADQ